MKFSDLTKNMSNMTDDELREHVRSMRHTKNVVKPAKVKHEADAEKKEVRQKSSKVSKMIGGMSDAEKQMLLQLLEGEGNE